MYYNLLMLAVDGLALGVLRAHRTALVWCGAMAFAAFTGLALAVHGAGEFFGMSRLATYAFFLHGTVLLLGSAVVLWRAKRWLAIGSALMAAGILAIAADAFLVEPTWLEVSHVRIASPNISRLVRVVVLADLQTDQIGPYEQMVLRRVAQEKPDLLLLAGDYLQMGCQEDYGHGDIGEARHCQFDQMNRSFRELGIQPPLGAFAVRGNVDQADWQRIFDGANVRTIESSSSFDLGPLRLTCLSLGDSADVSLKIDRPSSSQFHIVLGHVPNYCQGQINADLLLAGHTHGGQVRLPWIGPLRTLARIPRAWASGLNELPGGRKLLVSRGVGMERGRAPRLRFLCRPELVVIDLVPARE